MSQSGSKKERRGLYKFPEYNVWRGMKTRCRNHVDYFGRGIRVCKKWINSFEAFYKDMGPRPSNLYSIDRINNNGNYEPSSCRWATRSQQCLNTRRNHHIKFKGKNKTITEWAKELKMDHMILVRRLKKYPIDIALSPLRGNEFRKARKKRVKDKPQKRFVTEKFRQSLIKRRNKGESFLSIGRSLNLNSGTIFYIVNRKPRSRSDLKRINGLGD